jgi:hypothetical protein
MDVSREVSIALDTFDGKTVEVTIRGETRRLEAVENILGMRVYGIAGRYQTGTKSWPGFLTYKVDPTNNTPWIDASFGFDSRSAKHNKRPTIFFQEQA